MKAAKRPRVTPSVHRVLLIVKRSEYTSLSSGRTKKDARLRKLLDSEHASVARIVPAHEEHAQSVRIVRTELRARGLDVVERDTAPQRPVRGFDLVVSVGGDGTLLEASHAVGGSTMLLGVNSAPAFSVGFLTGCRAPTFASTIDALLAGRLKPLEVQRLQVKIGRRVIPEPVLNDVLFCADNPAVTTRYRLVSPEGEELHRSSGVWVSTPAGSTAALRSAGGPTLSLVARQLAFVVREPYAPPGMGVLQTMGVLEEDDHLDLECMTHAASVFLDGHHRRYSVRFGETVRFSLASKPLQLVRRRNARGE
ncbi:NAD(+)/NADH kinase [Myxococcota bacterium]|nr:NAD(+)/NADH kinase [Myxococcota bacterium]